MEWSLHSHYTQSIARYRWYGMYHLFPLSNQPKDAGYLGDDGVLPDISSLRIPLQYLANLLTAGDIAPVKGALNRMLAMRHYKRAETGR